MSVRVRFAPSPTGYLHVGGLRTALYNYLFAKHNGGTCILRIEDTDRTRFVENAQDNLVDALRWAGIEFDESPEKGGNYGPYIQSERFDLYKEYGKKLLESKAAYLAFDTAEEIEAMRNRQQSAGVAPKYDRTTMRNEFTLGEIGTKKLMDEGVPYVLRLKVEHNAEVKFHDIIRNEVIVKGKDIDDQILLKSDGFPTYHLANVVDDHLMAITHVIRGEEWLPSTPKHILLYEAFGWEAPKFAHLPLLLNDDKSKLSKRNGSVSVEEFRANGYFKDAFVNFVALLGWNQSGEQEIYTMEELISGFNLEKVNKSGAIFDRTKLLWMNNQYLRSIDPLVLADSLLTKLDDAGFKNISKEYAAKVIGLLRERVNFVAEIVEFGTYMFQKPIYDKEYYAKHWKADTAEKVLPLMDKLLESNLEHDTMEAITKEFITEKGYKFGEIMNPIRLMITGKPVGASMYETIAILGKEESKARIAEFLELSNSGKI
jgi:glutamyl-tRNA synthetase